MACAPANYFKPHFKCGLATPLRNTCPPPAVRSPPRPTTRPPSLGGPWYTLSSGCHFLQPATDSERPAQSVPRAVRNSPIVLAQPGQHNDGCLNGGQAREATVRAPVAMLAQPASGHPLSCWLSRCGNALAGPQVWPSWRVPTLPQPA